MELKITFLLFVFLAFCLVGKDLYMQIMFMVDHNMDNHVDCIIGGTPFCMINPRKAFIIEAKGIRTSKLIGTTPIDIRNLVSRNMFSVITDTGFGVFFCKKTIGKL